MAKPLIPASATAEIDTRPVKLELSRRDATHFSLTDDAAQRAYVVLKYFQGAHECFSDWDDDELKAFTDFIRKMNQLTWADIYKTAGALGSKTGLGYTVHNERKKLPMNGLISLVSPEIPFFELRVTKKARVHGFRSKNAFFLVWLDRNHAVCRM